MARQSGKDHGCGCFFGLWATVGDGGFLSLGGLPPKPPLSGVLTPPNPPKMRGEGGGQIGLEGAF
jgi:hypothetical protein